MRLLRLDSMLLFNRKMGIRKWVVPRYPQLRKGAVIASQMSVEKEEVLSITIDGSVVPANNESKIILSDGGVLIETSLSVLFDIIKDANNRKMRLHGCSGNKITVL